MADLNAFREKLSRGFREAFPGDERRLVYGEGPWDAPRLMLIGEAPGAQ